MNSPDAAPAGERVPGWYWVRYDGFDGWDLAYFTRGEAWRIAGSQYAIMPIEIDERPITRPPAPSAAPEVAALADRLEHLLRETAAQFRFYEESHRAKNTSDGNDKACVNAAWAGRLESDGGAILAALRSSPDGWATGAEAMREAAAKAARRGTDVHRGWILPGDHDPQVNREMYSALREGQEIERAIRALPIPPAKEQT